MLRPVLDAPLRVKAKTDVKAKTRRTSAESQNAILIKQLVKALHASQALNAKLTGALDRVLVSKFDAPLMPKPSEQPKRESYFPPDLSDVLSVEDDREFLERTS